MKLRTNLIFVGFISLAMLMGGQVSADENSSGAGTSVFNFLKIDVGARPIAMGGAFTGVADDETSLYYNPSGITDLEGKHFIAGYHNNVFDMQSGFLGYVHPVGPDHRIAAQINYLSYGDFIRTDGNGEELGTFGGSDMLFAASYAMRVRQNLSLGVTLKYIYEKIDTYSASGIAGDIGAKFIIKRDLYDNSIQAAAGIMIQNVGTQLSTFVDGSEKYDLPLTFRMGVSGYPKGLPLLLAGDIILPTDNDLYIALGAELLRLKPLFIRMGWTSFGLNYQTEAGAKDNLAGFSVGFGVEHKQMHISYTLSPQSDLGTSHRITITGGIY